MSKPKKEKKQPEKEVETKEEEMINEEEENTETAEVSEIEKLKTELQNKNDSYLRLAAEYDNYRKRTTAEKANIYTDATATAINEILPVADSLDMALQSAANAPDEYKKGLELVCNQLKSSLTKMNVEVFGEIGDGFDHDLHNAVSKIEDESLEENTIAQVLQKGYKIGDKIIRHAMVQVANCD